MKRRLIATAALCLVLPLSCAHAAPADSAIAAAVASPDRPAADVARDALRNPADTHDQPVFAPAIRGQTDQFVFRFRKPG